MLKIDKKTIDSMLALPDDRFAQMVRLVAAASGHSLRDGQPDSAAILGLRGLLRQVTEGDVKRASELLQIYKSSKK